MKDLDKILKGRKTLCFFDLEGTQITHEIIEIGAYKVTLREDGTIKKVHRPYKAYVKAKHPVGSVVTKLTGITDAKLAKEGIPYRQMQSEFIHYIGKDWDRALFIAYGSQDGHMFMASAENNMDASMECARYLSKRVFDFCHFLSHYIRSDAGDPLSLKHMCEVFGISFEGQQHDALSDAYNLLCVYRHFLSDTDIVKEQYEKVLVRSNSIPYPARKLIRMLKEGKTATIEDLNKAVEEAVS